MCTRTKPLFETDRPGASRGNQNRSVKYIRFRSMTTTTRPARTPARRGQRVACPETRKPGEVTVERPDLARAMLQRKRGNMCVVHEVARCPPAIDHPTHVAGMRRPFAQHDERRRCEQRLEILEGVVEVSGRVEHARVCDDPQELIDAGPWQGPRLITGGQTLEHGARRGVLGKLLPPGVHEQVGVDGDHYRLSIRSNSASRSSSFTPGCRRPRSVRHFKTYPDDFAGPAS